MNTNNTATPLGLGGQVARIVVLTNPASAFNSQVGQLITVASTAASAQIGMTGTTTNTLASPPVIIRTVTTPNSRTPYASVSNGQVGQLVTMPNNVASGQIGMSVPTTNTLASRPVIMNRAIGTADTRTLSVSNGPIYSQLVTMASSTAGGQIGTAVPTTNTVAPRPVIINRPVGAANTRTQYASVSSGQVGQLVTMASTTATGQVGMVMPTTNTVASQPVIINRPGTTANARTPFVSNGQQVTMVSSVASGQSGMAVPTSNTVASRQVINRPVTLANARTPSISNINGQVCEPVTMAHTTATSPAADGQVTRMVTTNGQVGRMVTVITSPASTSADSGQVAMVTDGVGSDIVTNGCQSCLQLQQQVDDHKKEQTFYSNLKKKIVLTDALIRKYNSKCQEFDLQQKKVDELTHRLASSKRDCKLLEEQLAKTLKEIIPWKREKGKFMEEYESNKKQMTAAKDALMANQAGLHQYRIQISEMDKGMATLKKEAADAKLRVKGLHATLDKRKFNVEDSKNEIAQVRKDKKNLAGQFERAKETILRLKNALQENKITLPRVPANFLPKGSTDTHEVAKMSDESMVSSDDDEKDESQEPEETPYSKKIQGILNRKEPSNVKSMPATSGGCLPSARKVGAQVKKKLQKEHESSSDDNISGSEVMSNVADEIDAQLNLTESGDDSRGQRSLRSQITKPGTALSQVTKPGPAKFQATKHGPARSEATKPGPAKLQAAKSGLSTRTSAASLKVRNPIAFRKSGEWTSPTRVTNAQDRKQLTSPPARKATQQVKKTIPTREIKGSIQRREKPSSIKTGTMSRSEVVHLTKGNKKLQSRTMKSKETISDSDTSDDDNNGEAKKTPSNASKSLTRTHSHSGQRTTDNLLKNKQEVCLSASSDDDDNAKKTSSIASRTRTRSQSHSTQSPTENSSRNKQVTSKAGTAKDELKFTKLIPKETTLPKTRRQFQKDSSSVREDQKNKSSSESDTSDEEVDRRKSPPRTRSQSHSGTSGAEKTTTNKIKVLVKKRSNVKTTQSDTSDDDMPRMKRHAKRTQNDLQKESAVVKAMVSLSDTSNDDSPKTATRNQSKSTEKKKPPDGATSKKASVRDPTDDDAQRTTTTTAHTKRYQIKSKETEKSPDDVNNFLPDTSEEDTQSSTKTNQNIPLKLKEEHLVVKSKKSSRSDTSKDDSKINQKKLTKEKSPGIKNKTVSSSDSSDENSHPFGEDATVDSKEKDDLALRKDLKKDDNEDSGAQKASKDTKSSSVGVNTRQRRNTDTEFEAKRYPKRSRRGLRGQKDGGNNSGDVGRTFYSDGDVPFNVKHGRILDTDDVFKKDVKRTKRIHDSSEESGSDAEASRRDEIATGVEDTKVTSEERQEGPETSGKDVSKQTANESHLNTNKDASGRPIPRSQNTESGSIGQTISGEGQSSKGQGESSADKSPVNSQERTKIRAEDLVLSPFDSAFRKKFLKPISPVRSSPRRRRINLSSDDESPVSDVKINPFFPPKRVTVTAGKLPVELSSNKSRSPSAEDCSPDGKDDHEPSPGGSLSNRSAKDPAPDESNVPGSSAMGVQTSSEVKLSENLSSEDPVIDERDIPGPSPVGSSSNRNESFATNDPAPDDRNNPEPSSVEMQTRSEVKRIESLSSEHPLPDERDIPGPSAVGEQTRSEVKADVNSSSERSDHVKRSEILSSEDPLLDKRDIPGPSAVSKQARSEVKANGNSSSERSDHVQTRCRSCSPGDAVTEKFKESLEAKLSETQNKVQEREHEDTEEMKVSQRVTRSRKQRKSSEEEQESQKLKTKDLPGTSAGKKQQAEEAQFAEPISTKSFYSQRRRRSVSSTSSTSDISTSSDVFEHQSPGDDKTASGSAGPSKRRTRSMSAKRADVKPPVRITRSISEPRKGSSNKIKNEFDGQPKITAVQSSPVPFQRPKSPAPFQRPTSPAPSRRVNRTSPVPSERSTSQAPARRVTRLQATKNETDVRDEQTSGEHGGKSPTLKRTRSAFKNREDAKDNDRKSAKKHKGDPNEPSLLDSAAKIDTQGSSPSSEVDKDFCQNKKAADQPSVSAQLESSRESTPSPASDHSAPNPPVPDLNPPVPELNPPVPELNPPVPDMNPPILEPFQNYAVNQAEPAALPELYEEQDGHRHMSPISPLLEPFQNLVGQRSLSPLPISPPSDSPPPMERPLSAMSLPDLPPMPDLIAPLPPSPLRSILTRNSSRLANPVRMVSPLTTPPPVLPRAISPLSQPPMPDAISPLKDEDSLDSLPGRQSPQRCNLIPSPRNFHAVAPRHAVAVPPHPAGHLFQAARCLTGNFEDAERDEDVPGPSGINSRNFDEHMFKVPASENDHISKLMSTKRNNLNEKSQQFDENQFVENEPGMSQDNDRNKSDTNEDANQQKSNDSDSKCDDKQAVQESERNKDIQGSSQKEDVCKNNNLEEETKKSASQSDLGEGEKETVAKGMEDKSGTQKIGNKAPRTVGMCDTVAESTDTTGNSSDQNMKSNVVEDGKEVGENKDGDENKTNVGQVDEEEDAISKGKGTKRGKGKTRKCRQVDLNRDGPELKDSSKQRIKAATRSVSSDDSSGDEKADSGKEDKVGIKRSKRRGAQRLGKDKQTKEDSNKEALKDEDKPQNEGDTKEHSADSNAPKAIMTRGKRQLKSLDARQDEDSVVQRRQTRLTRSSTSKEVSPWDVARMALEKLGPGKKVESPQKGEASESKKHVAGTVSKVRKSKTDISVKSESKETGDHVDNTSTSLKHSVESRSPGVKDTDSASLQNEKTVRTTRGRRKSFRAYTSVEFVDVSEETVSEKDDDDYDAGDFQKDEIIKTRSTTKRKTSSVVRNTRHATRGKKRKDSIEDALAVLEKEGIVDSEIDVPSKKVAPRELTESSNEDNVSGKQNPSGKPAQESVKHKVTAKPCSSNMASSKRTVIMIPAADMRVSGFKRSASWQKRRELIPAKSPGSSDKTTSSEDQTKSASDVPADSASSQSASVSTPACTQNASVSTQEPTQNATVCTPVPTQNTSDATIVPTKNAINFTPVSTQNASNSTPRHTQNAPVTITGPTHKATRCTQKDQLIALVSTPDPSHNTSVSTKESAQNASVLNLGPSQNVSIATSVHTQNTTVSRNSASCSAAGPTKGNSGSIPGSTQNASISIPGRDQTVIQGSNQGVTASATKPSNKISSVWGNIAQETRNMEKQRHAEKIKLTEQFREARPLRKGRKQSKVGNVWGKMAATADSNVEEIISEEQKKSLRGGRVVGGTALPLPKSAVGSTWGDFTGSGEGQQEICRRRRKIPMADKIPAKQKKMQESGTRNNSSSATQAKPSGPPVQEEYQAYNNAHIDLTLGMIATYRIGTNASRLTSRIVTNFLFNALDLLPVVFARCNAGNTTTEPVIMPVEEKIINALMDWTKKNECTTLVDHLLTHLRQAIEWPKSRGAFPKISTLCRMYILLCLHTKNLQRARVFTYEVVRNDSNDRKIPYQPRLLLAIAAIWPAVLCKQESVQVSPVGTVIEAVMMWKLAKDAHSDQMQKVQQIFISLCGWRLNKEDTLTEVTQQVVAMIQDVNITQLIDENDPNPALIQMAFELSKAVELLASSMGWEWTNDTLIREHLWPVLKKWSMSLRTDNAINNGSACLVMKIIANVGILGLSKNRQSVSEVMKMLLAVLQQPGSTIPWSVQLYTTDAVLQLSAANPSQSYPVLHKWRTEASQPIPPSLSERINVLGKWVSNMGQQQTVKTKLLNTKQSRPSSEQRQTVKTKSVKANRPQPKTT